MRFDIRNYREIQKILVEALDFEALPECFPVDLPVTTTPEAPRFARPLSQMLASIQRVNHDLH